MSDTPRTDAHNWHDGDYDDPLHAFYDFARQLERELNAANAEIERITNIKGGGANTKVQKDALTFSSRAVQKELEDAGEGTGPFAELQREINLANAAGNKEAAAAAQQKIEALRIQRQNQLAQQYIETYGGLTTGGAASAGLEGLEDFFR